MAERAGIVALVSFLLFLGLGAAVSHGPPGALDTAIGAAFFGGAPQLAERFTQTGLLGFVAPFCVVLLVVAAIAKRWRARLIFAVASVAVVHVASDVLKDLFKRPRPDHWLIARETSFSYASGHAATAAALYAFLAWIVWRSELPAPVRRTLAAALGLWALGICWSRLALGVHYPSDIAGGFLLGIAVISLGLWICDRFGVALDARMAESR